VGGLDGDDLLARGPVTGERDVRSEDRQLLLDAILAAQEHLVITYTGADPHSGARRPPAVPLGELLDALDATATTTSAAGTAAGSAAGDAAYRPERVRDAARRYLARHGDGFRRREVEVVATMVGGDR
jgi:exonuclease V gamma subunit